MQILENGRRIVIRQPDDWHMHLRWDERLSIALEGLVIGGIRRALIMPNTNEHRAIFTAYDAVQYRWQINEYFAGPGTYEFDPVMSLKLRGATTVKDIYAAHEAGVKAVKLYPSGVTENSADGVTLEQVISSAMGQVYDAIAECGMLLLIHGEMPSVFCMDREKEFLFVIEGLLRRHPELRIVLEHISTADAVHFVENNPSENIAATITVHHLLLTLDDVVGDSLHPHNFCKPIAKRPEDQKALLDAALSGNERFFFGGDSAPPLSMEKGVCRRVCRCVLCASSASIAGHAIRA